MAVKMKPHKLEEAKIKKIVQGIQTGLPQYKIAASVGVNRKTLRNWLGDREDPHPFVRKLQREVAQAEEEFIEERVDQVKQAARGGAEYGETRITKTGKSLSSIRQVPPDWRAAAWLLERRYPKSFALRHIEVEDDVTDDDLLIIGVTHAGKTQDLFAEYLDDHPFNSKPQGLFAVHEAPVAARKAPYKLTEAKIKTIVQGVRKGLPWSVIAAAVGVNRKTLWNWLRDQEDPHPLVWKLQQEVWEAAAAFIQELVDLIKQAARGGAEYREIRVKEIGDSLIIIRQVSPDWRAAAWFLERRFPESYSERHIKVEDDVPGDDPLIVEMTYDDESQDLFAE